MKKTLFIFLISFASILGVKAQKQTRIETQTTTTTTYENAQARIPDVYVQPVVKPLVCEVEVIPGAKNEFTTTMTSQQVKSLNNTVENMRMYAAYLFTEDTKSDMIVAATYHIQSQPDGSFIVSVKGFPAKFKNWHTATRDDYEWMRIGGDNNLTGVTYKPAVKQ